MNRAHSWKRLVVLLVTCSLGVPSPGETVVNPSGLEINLGPIPIDLYKSLAAHPADTFPDCPVGYTVRQCVRRMFLNVAGAANPEYTPKNYIRQGVKGVRFMLAIGGGYYSTPYPQWKTDPSNTPSPDWADAVQTFFGDLKLWGIVRVTATPIVREDWSRGSDSDWRVACPQGVAANDAEKYECTPNQTALFRSGSGARPLRFLPWSPYGYVHGPLCSFIFQSSAVNRANCQAADGWEDGVADNQAYANSPENPYFGAGTGNWGGWTKFVNMMDKIFEAASSSGLQLGDVDLVNELHPILLTVQGRFVYDNKANVDVLAQIQQRLAARGFNPGLATYSVPIDRPSNSKSVGAYCKSQFGNWGNEASGLIPYAAALSNLVGGAPFGQPMYRREDLSDVDSLPNCLQENARASACADPLTRESCRFTGLPTAPVGSSRVAMTTLNMHTHVCKAVPVGGAESGNGCTLEDSTQIAKATYDAVQIYMDNHGRSSNLVVFGETNGNQVRNSTGFTPAHARWNATGFLQSTLYSQKGGNVRLRPWNYVASNAYEAPHSLASYGADVTPIVVSITPSDAQYVEGKGARLFNVLVRHAGTVGSISNVELLFNREASDANGCLIDYTLSTGAHVLKDDTGIGSVPAVNGVFENSECSIGSAAGTITRTETQQEFVLSVPVTFRAAQARLVWARAFSDVTKAGPYKDEIVRGPVSGRPIVVAANPPAGSAPYVYPLSITFRHPTHSEELNVLNVLIRDGLDANEACYITLETREKKISLAKDYPVPTDYFVGSYGANNSAGSLQNSRCRITGGANEVTTNGATLTWNLNLEFFQTFLGDKIIHVAGRDLSLELIGGASGDFGNSGWQRLGVLRVPPQYTYSLPRTYSHSPASGTGTIQTFTTIFERSSSSVFSRAWVLFQDYLDGRNACYVAYAADQNRLYLVNNGGTDVLGSITPGSSDSLSNDQCTLDGATSSAQQFGNSMMVTLGLGFKPPFGGRRVAYTASQTVDGATSPWQSTGTWLIP